MANYLRTRALIGAEDLSLGNGTFARPTSTGGTQTMTKLSNIIVPGMLVYNVKDYAAVGDGSTDDSSAINSAISAANAAGGGIVYFPAATYIVGSTLSLVGISNVYLMGAGPTASVIQATSSFNGDIIRIRQNGAAEPETSEGGFIGLRIVGNSQANTVGIHAGDSVGLVFRDLLVRACSGSAGYGILLDTTNLSGGQLWTERTVIDHVMTSQNRVGLGFVVNGGMPSFGYTRMLAFHSADVSIGIYIGPGASVYHSFIGASFNLGAATAFNVAGSMVNNIYAITFEGTGNAFNVSGIMSGSGDVRGKPSGTWFSGAGTLAITQPEPGDSAAVTYQNGATTGQFTGGQTNYLGFTRADQGGGSLMAALALWGNSGLNQGGMILWLPNQVYDRRGSFQIIKGTPGSPSVIHAFNNDGSAVHGGTAPAVAAGQLGLGGTTAASATAGSNGAVPAQVAGYLIVNIGGTNYKLPYYNT